MYLVSGVELDLDPIGATLKSSHFDLFYGQKLSKMTINDPFVDGSVWIKVG